MKKILILSDKASTTSRLQSLYEVLYSFQKKEAYVCLINLSECTQEINTLLKPQKNKVRKEKSLDIQKSITPHMTISNSWHALDCNEIQYLIERESITTLLIPTYTNDPNKTEQYINIVLSLKDINIEVISLHI